MHLSGRLPRTKARLVGKEAVVVVDEAAAGAARGVAAPALMRGIKPCHSDWFCRPFHRFRNMWLDIAPI